MISGSYYASTAPCVLLQRVTLSWMESWGFTLRTNQTSLHKSNWFQHSYMNRLMGTQQACGERKVVCVDVKKGFDLSVNLYEPLGKYLRLDLFFFIETIEWSQIEHYIEWSDRFAVKMNFVELCSFLVFIVSWIAVLAVHKLCGYRKMTECCFLDFFKLPGLLLHCAADSGMYYCIRTVWIMVTLLCFWVCALATFPSRKWMAIKFVCYLQRNVFMVLQSLLMHGFSMCPCEAKVLWFAQCWSWGLGPTAHAYLFFFLPDWSNSRIATDFTLGWHHLYSTWRLFNCFAQVSFIMVANRINTLGYFLLQYSTFIL